jgi:hypothetical protein
MGSNPSASVSSSAADSSVLAEKAIATMDLELAAQANDPERRLGHKTGDGNLGSDQILRRTLCSVFST